MKYRNTKTGRTVDTSCEIFGADWEAVEASRPVSFKQEIKEEEPVKPVKRATRKK